MPPQSLKRRLHLLILLNLLLPIVALVILFSAHFSSSYLAKDFTTLLATSMAGIGMAFVGIATLFIGVRTTIQIAKGKWNLPASLGSWLIIVGLLTSVSVICGAGWLAFIEACKNGCL